LREVKWILITRENYQQVFEELAKNKKDIVLFGLSDDGYEALSLNNSDLMRVLEQKNAIIAAYKNYYEKSTQAIDAVNGKILQDRKAAEELNKPEPGFFERLFD